MDFNNNEIKENIILYIAKPLSQSKYIENLVLSTPPQHQKKLHKKSCLKCNKPLQKNINIFTIIKSVAKQPKRKHISKL